MISFIIWILFSLASGPIEAIYFIKRTNTFNPHILFTIIRIIVLGLIYLFSGSWIVVLYPLVFTFLHDGMYYVTRDRLDHSYPLGWWSQSTTSTSILDRLQLTTPIIRTILFVIGLVLIMYKLK